MFLVYKPEGQPEQRWHYLPGRLKTAEMIAIEKRTGVKYGQQFKQDLMQGGTVARQALLWTFLRRTHHTISFDDVDFYDDELQLVMDKDEITAEIKALEDTDIEGLSDLEKSAGLSLLRQQLAEAPDAPGKAPAATTAEPPSSDAPSPASGTSVGSAALPPPLPDPEPPVITTTVPADAPTPPVVQAASTT